MTLQNYAFTVVNAKASPYAFVVFEELHFANVEFFFFRAFPSLVAMRTKQQVVKCCPPTSWVGLYLTPSASAASPQQ